MGKVKFGIIGFGFMGHVHEEMLTELIEEAEVVAICDCEPSQMEDAVTENVKKYTDYKELLKDDEIDTVLVVIPNHLHKECVIEAAKAHKNIICEKPVAMNSMELDVMLQAVEEHHVRFTVHQQRRFDKDYLTMKKIYENGKVGNVYTIQSKLYGLNGNMHDWHIYPEFGGGMLFDWGVHLIDQMLDMVDSTILSVYADVRKVINEKVDDYFKIIIKFANGVTGEIELGTYFLKDQDKWFERHWFIGGNRGTAYSDGFNPEGKIAGTTHLLQSVEKKVTMSKSGPTRSFGPPQPGVLITEDLPSVKTHHRLYFDNYIEGLKNQKEFLVKPHEVKRVMKVIEAAVLSSKENRVVVFEEDYL